MPCGKLRAKQVLEDDKVKGMMFGTVVSQAFSSGRQMSESGISSTSKPVSVRPLSATGSHKIYQHAVKSELARKDQIRASRRR